MCAAPDVDMGLLSSGTVVGCRYPGGMRDETEKWVAKAKAQIGVAEYNKYDHYE